MTKSESVTTLTDEAQQIYEAQAVKGFLWKKLTPEMKNKWVRLAYKKRKEMLNA